MGGQNEEIYANWKEDRGVIEGHDTETVRVELAEFRGNRLR